MCVRKRVPIQLEYCYKSCDGMWVEPTVSECRMYWNVFLQVCSLNICILFLYGISKLMRNMGEINRLIVITYVIETVIVVHIINNHIEFVVNCEFPIANQGRCTAGAQNICLIFCLQNILSINSNVCDDILF